MAKIDIDKFFKEGLSHADVSFDESNWLAMEKLLQSRKRQRRKNIIALFSTGVAAAIALFFIISSDFNSEKNTTSNHITSIISSIPKVTSVELPKDSIYSSNNAIELKDSVILGKSIVKVGNNEFYKFDDTSSNANLLIDENYNRPKVEKDDIKPLISDLVHPMPNHFQSKKFQFDIPDTLIATQTTLAFNDNATLRIKDVSEEGKIQRSFGTLSIMAAPDLTSVQGAGDYSLSQNIGLLYTQNISKRFSLSTGVLYSRKNYNSTYSFYNPKNAPKITTMPDNVSALCDVIDVPIVVNYTFFQNRKYSLVVGAGVSNYFMLRENYTFSYSGTNNSRYGTKDGKYEVGGKNNHWLGIADFSFSIERKISNRISIGIRPFVQLPLTGVGYGRVKLESKGIAITTGLNLFK